MAYQKTNWKDRAVERPRTYRMQQNPDGTVTLIPEPGTVYEAGTPVNAPNMNKIEQGIVDATQLAIDWAKSFGLGANVPYASDLNALPLNDGTGFYKSSGNDTKNTPPGVNGNGSVIHIARDVRPSQIFMDYVTNRVFIRGYTSSGWNNWEEIESVTGAQQKANQAANQAEDNAKNASVNKFAAYGGANPIDPNTTADAYIITNHANVPTGSGYWHIRTYYYSDPDNTRAQMAIRYIGGDDMYIRQREAGAWTPWKRVWHSGNTPQTRLNNGVFEVNDGGWKPVGGVKQVLRGAVIVEDANIDVAISSVNMAKSSVRLNTIYNQFHGDNYGYKTISATLTSSTNLRFTVSNQNSINVTVQWEVIESY